VVLESYSTVMEGNRYVEYQTLRGGSAGIRFRLSNRNIRNLQAGDPLIR
jgi:hypothetical protein